MQKERIPDEEVSVKISSCNKCNGVVRAAVEHEMNKESKEEFMEEVFKYNLSVKTMPLLEYRNNKPNWCSC